MIGVDVRPLADHSSVISVEAVPGAQSPVLLTPPDDGTNTVSIAYSLSFIPATEAEWDVDRTIDYAMTNYETLLRRLAD